MIRFYILPFIIGIITGIILLVLFKDQKIEIIDYPKPNDNHIYKDICFLIFFAYK